MRTKAQFYIPNQIVPVFLGVLGIWGLMLLQDFDLKEISNGVFGIASLDAFDVTARTQFYKQALAVMLGIPFLWLIAEKQSWISKSWKEKSFFKELKIFAFVGTIALFFLLVGNPMFHSLNFILTVFALRVFWAIMTSLFSRNDFSFWEALVPIISLVFCLKLLPFAIKYPFNDLCLITGSLVIFLRCLLNYGKIKGSLKNIVYLLPLASFLFVEIHEIFLQRNKQAIVPIVLILVASGLLYWIWKKGITGKVLYPSLAILGVIYFNYYGITEQPVDLFELANPANSLHRLVNFGQLPFIDFLSSHLLSEQIPAYFYALLNRFDGSVDFIIYQRCLEYGIMATVGYFFLRKLFGNRNLALTLVLFFPFYLYLIPRAYAASLFFPFLIYGIWKDFSERKLILLLALSVGLLFWKVDLGIANLVAIIICLILFLIEKKSKPLLFKFLKIAGIGLISLLVIFGFAEILFEGSLLLNLKKTAAYFGENQAHGFSELTYFKGRQYYYHYFIFPIFIAAAVYYFSRELLLKKQEKQNLFWIISILYLGIFILTNFPRGLVRHSFISGGDTFLSSFIYLMVPLTISYFIKAKWRPIAFVIITTLFIHNFKFQNPHLGESFFEKSYSLLSNKNQFANWNKKQARVSSSEDFKNETYSELKNFMDNNFSAEATFLDFSNHPMLYFYTQRKVPSFFNQYLQNTVGRELQRWNLDYIMELDIPIVIFRSIPPSWLDASDGIPNSLRYLEITSFIYSNYEPYTVLDNREIWIKKDLRKPSGNYRSTFFPPSQIFDFKNLPALLNESQLETQIENQTISTTDSIIIYPDFYRDSPQYLKMLVNNNTDGEQITLKIFQQSKECANLTFDKNDQQEFLIPISWLDCWQKRGSLLIRANGNLAIEKLSLLSTEATE